MKAAAAAKSFQLCPTLCDPIDSSPPGSPVPGILEARTLEQVAIFFSSAWKWKVKMKSFNHVWLLATPWTAAYQAPPSMWFSRQEYWNGVPNHWTDWEFSTFMFKIRLLIFSCPSNWSNIENKLTNTCHFKNFCLFLLASHELLSSYHKEREESSLSQFFRHE